MVLHVVLYRPKPDVTPDTLASLADLIASTAAAISDVRSFRVGMRLADGPPYLGGAFPDFPFMAVVEFDNREGLLRYLQHPAHEALGRAFNTTAAAALVYDYVVADGAGAGGWGIGAGRVPE